MLEDTAEQLRTPVAAAHDWINSTQGKQFDLTGLIGEPDAVPERALSRL